MLKLAALAVPALFLLPVPSQEDAAKPVDATGSYVIDGVHSFVTFRVQHLGVSYSYGRFNKVEGEMAFDAKAPEKSKVKITVDAASLDTANEKRDQHLRSPDFFNTMQFPEITFESTSFKKGADGKYELGGELTLLGKKKAISFPVEHVGVAETRRGVKTGFEGRFTLRRSEFGMNYMLDGLGDEVTVMVSLEANRK